MHKYILAWGIFAGVWWGARYAAWFVLQGIKMPALEYREGKGDKTFDIGGHL